MRVKLLLALLLLVSGEVRDEDDGAGVEALVGDLLLAVPAGEAQAALFVEGPRPQRLGIDCVVGVSVIEPIVGRRSPAGAKRARGVGWGGQVPLKK